MDPDLDPACLRLRLAIGWKQGEYAHWFGLSYHTVMRRERLARCPKEGLLTLRWLQRLGRGRFPSRGDELTMDALRDPLTWRHQREALGLTVADLAKELGISIATGFARESGRAEISREAAVGLIMVGERLLERQRATLEALRDYRESEPDDGTPGPFEPGFDPLEDATG